MFIVKVFTCDRTEISTSHERNFFYITFHFGINEIEFRFGCSPTNTSHSARVSHSCFDEINAFVDVSFRMISFQEVFT